MTTKHLFVNQINWKKLGLLKAPNFENKDHFLCTNSVTLYLHKNMQGDPSNVAVINGFFSGLKQPSKKKVEEAMILIIDEDYALKSGGDSMSSSQYSSSLKILVADEKTGLDKEVVVLKKWSKTFDEVLITAEEIRKLFKEYASDKEKEVIEQSDIETLLAFTFRVMKGSKVNINGKKRKATKSEIDELIDACRNFPKDKVEKTIDGFIQRNKNKLDDKFIEDTPGVNKTERYRNSTQENIDAWMKLKELILI